MTHKIDLKKNIFSRTVFQSVFAKFFTPKKKTFVVCVKSNSKKRSDLATKTLSEWTNRSLQTDVSFVLLENAQKENRIRCFKTKALKTAFADGDALARIKEVVDLVNGTPLLVGSSSELNNPLNNKYHAF